MFCYNCGKELNDDFNLCPYCGADITRYSDETADKAKEYIVKTQNPAISGLERSRCRSSQEITDSPTPFSALNCEEHPRPFGAGSPEGNPSFSDAPYRPPECSRWQGQPGYWGNPGSSRSTAHTHRFWPAPQ